MEGLHGTGTGMQRVRFPSWHVKAVRSYIDGSLSQFGKTVRPEGVTVYTLEYHLNLGKWEHYVT